MKLFLKTSSERRETRETAQLFGIKFLFLCVTSFVFPRKERSEHLALSHHIWCVKLDFLFILLAWVSFGRRDEPFSLRLFFVRFDFALVESRPLTRSNILLFFSVLELANYSISFNMTGTKSARATNVISSMYFILFLFHCLSNFMCSTASNACLMKTCVAWTKRLLPLILI